MALFLGLAVVIWAASRYLRWPRALLLQAYAALYVLALIVTIILPAEHGLRQSLGGSPAPLLVLAFAIGVIWGYRRWLSGVRSQAKAQDGESEEPTQVNETPLRHARHIMLRDIGGAGQQRLANAKVLVIGAGGLGLPVAAHLNAAGVGCIGMIDPDEVELSNLPRQIIYTREDVGAPKVRAAFHHLRAQNGDTELRPYHRTFSAEIAEELFRDYDLVIEGSDDFATKQLANQTALTMKTPLLIAALSPWEAQMMWVTGKSDAPCYACVFPNAPIREAAPSCAEAGVVAPLPHLVGAAMALEAVKFLTGAADHLENTLWSFDGRTMQSERFAIKRNLKCSVCATTS